MPIDWTNPACAVSDHFSVKDCIWLGHLGRLANELDGLDSRLKERLIETCEMAENIRSVLDRPLRVTSMYRPPEYSVSVGGSEHDVHTRGIAIDFYPIGMEIAEAKKILRPHLASLGIRMERGTDVWIHIDSHEPGPSGREFVP